MPRCKREGLVTIERHNLHQLTINGLFIALVTVATLAIRVPVPATTGYINVGDTMIYLAALVGGPKAGLIAGGVGSAIADLLGGYPQWAPWTLVIKGLQGLIAGVLAYSLYRQRGAFHPGTALGLAAAGLWMVVGYYVAGGLIFGFGAALAEVPGNLVQGLGSVVIATPLLAALRRLRQSG